MDPVLSLPPVSIAVATFGDDRWAETAHRVALPSARATGAPVVHVHAGTMHGARNECLARISTKWVIYLDADDELEPGYLDAMMRGVGDVRAPRVRYITQSGSEPEPAMPKVVWPAGRHARHRLCSGACLKDGNWVVIGAMARAGLLRQVGGWRPFALEDWDMWLRCYLAGASIEPVLAAVYRAHGRLSGRGLGSDVTAMLAAHRAVATANGVRAP